MKKKIQRRDLRSINLNHDRDSQVRTVKNLKEVIDSKFILIEPKQARALVKGAMLRIEGMDLVLEVAPVTGKLEGEELLSAGQQRGNNVKRMKNRNKEGFYRQGKVRRF